MTDSSPDGAMRNPGRAYHLATLSPHFADAPCGLCRCGGNDHPNAMTARDWRASHRHGLGPARLAVREIIAQRDGGLRGRDLAAAVARLRQPEQLAQGAARAPMQDDRAAGRGELGEGVAARDVVGPAADAGRRLALVPEPTHVELLARDIAALQHAQLGDQRLDLDLRETKLLCRFEVLCQHVVSPLAPHPMIRAHAAVVNGVSTYRSRQPTVLTRCDRTDTACRRFGASP